MMGKCKLKKYKKITRNTSSRYIRGKLNSALFYPPLKDREIKLTFDCCVQKVFTDTKLIHLSISLQRLDSKVDELISSITGNTR